MADRLRLEVLLAAVDKVSAPLKRMGQGAKALAGDVGAAEAALRKLESQQRGVEGFKRAADQLRATRPAAGRAPRACRAGSANPHRRSSAEGPHRAVGRRRCNGEAAERQL